MGKPTTDDNTSAAPAAAPVQAVPGNAEAAVIRAVPGQPWPQPPAGGRWVQNPKAGDLTCVEAAAQPPTEEERRARRDAQRAAAIKAANSNTKE